MNTETREYVFTEWDPTAASDLEALRAVFDSNGDVARDRGVEILQESAMRRAAAQEKSMEATGRMEILKNRNNKGV